MNSKVDWFFNKSEQWQKELEQLRRIVLDCGLTEEMKWGVPCYTYNDKNVVLIHAFKDYCALLFHKGALMNDAQGMLVQQTQNVQAARQLRFNNVQAITERETIIKAYIFEAIELEKAGLKVAFKKAAAFPVPEAFQKRMDENKELKTAFDALTPGRQRGYLLYFSAPKQARTQDARVAKCMQRILDGRGLND